MSGSDMNLQAMGAIGEAIGNTAENIANASTSGYRPSSTVLESGAGFVDAVVQRQSSLGSASTGGVDIAREMVNLISFENAFKVDAMAVRTIEQTTGSVLNLIT
jgi:flagellar hook protein FlgE